MNEDTIIEEVRRNRENYAKEFGFDLRLIVEDLRKKEQAHRDLLVSFPPKPPRNHRATK